jgi:hypothetical protein
MGTPFYVRSIIDRNVVMRRVTVIAMVVLKCGSADWESADRGFSFALLWFSPGLSALIHSHRRV